MRLLRTAVCSALLFGPPLSSAPVSQDSDKPSQREVIRKFLEAQRLASTGDKSGALNALEVVARGRRGFFPGPQSSLSKYLDDPAFGDIIARLNADFHRTANGRIAYRLTGRTLMPEGIAYDADSRSLFLSDWYKRTIYRLPLEGKPRAFVSMAELTPNGMSVDRRRHLLWATATNAFRGARQPRSALWRIDLKSGAKRIFSTADGKGFNDVAVAPNGDVYVSDTVTGQIFRLRRGAESLVPLLSPDDHFNAPNGLTLDDSGTYLFVTQAITPYRIRLSDGTAEPLKLPADLDMIGTDGFYFHDGDLYAVQNLTTPGTVLRLSLNKAMDTVTSVETLDSGNPKFDLPTAGAFVGGDFLVLANSQLYRAASERPVDRKALKPLLILRYPARKRAAS